MDCSSPSYEYENEKLVFIGGGNMARALIKGCLAKRFVPKENIVICVKSQNSLQKWLSEGYSHVYNCTNETLQAFPTATYVICVKPQVFDDIVAVWPVNSRPKLIISVMAGITLGILKSKLPFLCESATLVRIMPNVPCSIGSGASSLCHGEQNIPNQEEHINFAKKLAQCVGIVEIIPERCFNAATAVAGSSPAWVFMFIEALADGAVAQGLGRAEAKRLAAQSVMGAARMLSSNESDFDINNQHMGILKDQVCSPGGTTIEGVRTLERHGFRSAVIEAVISASEKAESMGKMLSK